MEGARTPDLGAIGLNILFLSHYFPPEVNAPATRTFEHCKEWSVQGHNVTVVTCAPHHPMGELYPGFKNRFFQREQIDGINVIRVLTYITANEGFLKRTANYVFYMIMAILIAPFLKRTDVVVSTSPQFFNGLAGYFVSRLKRSPWVLEIRDLWPESILAVGAVRNRRIIAFLEWIESFAYRKADRIVSVTQSFCEHIEKSGVDPKKIAVVRNGVDLEAFNNEDVAGAAIAPEFGLQGKFVAAYVGTHGMAHGLDTVLDAAELLKDYRDIAFLMVGDGAERARLLEMKQAKGLDNVVMLGQQSKDTMPAIWRRTDVSLVLLRRLDLFKSVIPSKIFESMAMGKPIVLGVEGEVAEIIEESGAGLCIEPESAEHLAKALVRLHEEKQLYKEMSESGRPYVSNHFDRKALAIKLLAVLESAAES